METTIPEKWWEKHEKEIDDKMIGIATSSFAEKAAESKWEHPLNTEEDILEMLKTHERKLEMSADDILDDLITVIWSKARRKVFEKHYGHLCVRNGKGEILIPMNSIYEIYYASVECVTSALNQLLIEHPEWVHIEEKALDE